MKLAITDACIFIDVIELRFTVRFFALDIEIHTSSLVMDELSFDQREILSEFVSTNRLKIIEYTLEYDKKIKSLPYPNSLAPADKSVLLLAEELQAKVLSSDKLVRQYAKEKAIEYHGLIWIFDKLLENGSLSAPEAINKLQDLLSSNPYYRNRPELVSEIEKRIAFLQEK